MRILVRITTILLVFSILYTAEIFDEKLLVDVLIAETEQFEISSTTPLQFREVNSPVSIEIKGQVQIQLIDSAYHEAIELTFSTSDKNMQGESDRKLEWNNNHLVFVKDETTKRESFLSEDQLNSFLEKNINVISRRNIKIFEGQICLTQNSTKQYLDLPVEVVSASPITISITGFNYTGSLFISIENEKMELINRLDFEEYLCGVVPNEIGTNSPEEAMKAQAVAARTIAVSNLLSRKHPHSHYDLCASTHCQVYKGLYNQNSITKKSVRETSGEILLFNNKPAVAVYHSCCGGRTEDSSIVWGGSKIPYLTSKTDAKRDFISPLNTNSKAENWIKSNKSVNCKDNKESSSWEKKAYSWTKTIQTKDIEEKLSIKGLKNITIQERGNSGRVIKMTVKHSRGTLTLTGEYKIRSSLGNLPSGLFYIKSKHPFQIVGKGSGHGVGMCQTGAINLAREKQNYKKILNHYYEGCNIAKMKIKQEHQ
ncbi:MAG: SpoIID/LytB domain-containing protein [Candidatus Cloacimonetes bacterium]|nr:SpoIID/LytB domain-containing protein [Candidatus Cloacimonadota bacterium]